MTGNLKSYVKAHSGNPMLFRGICAAIGLLCGINLGLAMGAGGAIPGFWAALLGILACISSWYMQRWANDLLRPEKRSIRMSLILCAVWLGLAALSGRLSTGILLIAVSLAAGLLAFFGGRRSEWGRQQMAQVLGFNRYLHTVPSEQLRRISESNPEYFFQLMPYALALGADKALARRLRGVHLPPCPYLAAGMEDRMTPEEWRRLIRRTAEDMNARLRQMPMERLSEIVRSFRR